MPPKKTSGLSEFADMPETLAKSLKHSRSILTEIESPLANKSRSSAKVR